MESFEKQQVMKKLAWNSAKSARGGSPERQIRDECGACTPPISFYCRRFEGELLLRRQRDWICDLQEILRKIGIHHAVFRVDLSSDLAEEFESTAKRDSRVVCRNLQRLIKDRYAAPVSGEVAEIDGKIVPPPCLC